MDAEHPAQQQIGRVTLVADGEYLGAALSFIREAAGRLGLAEPNVTALVRAVEEVSLNVIEHAFEGIRVEVAAPHFDDRAETAVIRAAARSLDHVHLAA